MKTANQLKEMKLDKLYLARVVGRQICRLRREQGLSGRELAVILGVSQQQVSRYELGVCRIDVDLLFYLLRQFNVTLEDFFISVSHSLKEYDSKLYRQYQMLFTDVNKESFFQEPKEVYTERKNYFR